MAARPKSTGSQTRRQTARSRKPATIDLEARKTDAEGEEKKVKDEVKTSPASAGSKTEKTETETAKPDAGKKPAAERVSKEAKTSVASPFISALAGGVVAILGLGVIGQFDGARNLPLIGPIYGDNGAGQQSGSTEEIAELRERIDQLSAQSDNTTGVDLGPVEQRIGELETLLSGLQESSGDGESSAALASLQATVEELARQVNTVGANAASGASVDSERLAVAEKTIAEVSTALNGLKSAVEQNATNLSELSSRSEDLNQTVASVKASEKVARSVAVNALATALENDDPLLLPISSLEALLGETAETTELKQLVQSGIPTRKSLVSGLDEFASRLQDQSVSEDATLSDRFWENAQKLVTFRSTGPREGDDALAIISRVRANVDKGELADAKAEWMKLSDDVRSRGASWENNLEQRIKAFALQKVIAASLIDQAG